MGIFDSLGVYGFPGAPPPQQRGSGVLDWLGMLGAAPPGPVPAPPSVGNFGWQSPPGVQAQTSSPSTGRTFAPSPLPTQEFTPRHGDIWTEMVNTLLPATTSGTQAPTAGNSQWQSLLSGADGLDASSAAPVPTRTAMPQAFTPVPNQIQQAASRGENMGHCLPLYVLCQDLHGNSLLRLGKRCGNCLDICLLDGFWPFHFCRL